MMPKRRHLGGLFAMVKQRTIATDDAYSIFLVDRRARGYTVGTMQFYRQKLGGLVRWSVEGGAERLDRVTAQMIRAYIVELTDRGMSPWTIHGVTRAARAFFNWALEEGMITASPMAKVANPKLPKEPLEPFADEEVQKMLTAAPDARGRALVLFLLDTGVRASECAALNGEDVNLRTGEVLEAV